MQSWTTLEMSSDVHNSIHTFVCIVHTLYIVNAQEHNQEAPTGSHSHVKDFKENNLSSVVVLKLRTGVWCITHKPILASPIKPNRFVSSSGG